MATKTALITGASSGIGLDFARKFAQEGCQVILVARSRDKLHTLAAELQQQHGIQAHVMPYDLSDPQSPEALFAAVQAAGLQVDILVNNAGFGGYGLFHENDAPATLQMIQVNITTLTHLTRLFLPGMVAQRSGYILNIASTAAFMPGPLMAVYYASKAYVLHFSEAIGNELAGTGVTVTTLCPGPTESNFQERAAMTESKLMQMNMMDRQTVVNAGYAALLQAQPVIIPGWLNRIQATLPRLLPRAWVTRIVRNAQERATH